VKIQDKSAPPRKFRPGADNSGMANPGDWIGTYGSLGVHIPGTVNPSGMPGINVDAVEEGGASAFVYVWSENTPDPRGLQRPNGVGRIASCYYTGSSMVLTLTGLPGPCRVTFYVCDWDGLARAQDYQVFAGGKAITSNVRIDSFQGGIYLGVDVPGDCFIRFTRTGGANAVVNGLFLDGVPDPPDTVSPAMVHSGISEDGLTLILTATEPLNGREGFVLHGAVETVLSFVGADETRTVLTYDVIRERPVWAGETLRLTYAPGDVTDDAGNPLVAITNGSVENRSTVPGPQWIRVLDQVTGVNLENGIRTGLYVDHLTWPN
jgi:hypothetical protein